MRNVRFRRRTANPNQTNLFPAPLFGEEAGRGIKATTVAAARGPVEPIILGSEVRSSRGEGPLTPYPFQARTIESSLQKDEKGKMVSTLVALPTNAGKTFIASEIIDKLNRENPDGVVIFLVHTLPLLYQQAKHFEQHLSRLWNRTVTVMGDEQDPDERVKTYQKDFSVLIGTSQVVGPDIVANRLDLQKKNVTFLFLDECQNAVENHSHNVAAKAAIAAGVPLGGLSASPGKNDEGIQTIIENLGVNNVVVYTRKELAEYLPKIEYIEKYVSLDASPDRSPNGKSYGWFFRHIRNRIHGICLDIFTELEDMHMLRSIKLERNLFGDVEDEPSAFTPADINRLMSYSELEQLKERLDARVFWGKGKQEAEVPFYKLSDDERAKRFPIMRALSMHAELMFYRQLLRYFESESMYAGVRHIEKTLYHKNARKAFKKLHSISEEELLNGTQIEKLKVFEEDFLHLMKNFRKQNTSKPRKKGKAPKRLQKYKLRVRENPEFMRMYTYLANNISTLPEHPKIPVVKRIKEEHLGLPTMILSDSRDQTKYYRRLLGASMLLGKNHGVTSKHQKEAVDGFANGQSSTLTATKKVANVGLKVRASLLIITTPARAPIDIIQTEGRLKDGGTIINLITLIDGEVSSDQKAFYAGRVASERNEKALKQVQRYYDAIRTMRA